MTIDGSLAAAARTLTRRRWFWCCGRTAAISTTRVLHPSARDRSTKPRHAEGRTAGDVYRTTDLVSSGPGYRVARSGGFSDGDLRRSCSTGAPPANRAWLRPGDSARALVQTQRSPAVVPCDPRRRRIREHDCREEGVAPRYPLILCCGRLGASRTASHTPGPLRHARVHPELGRWWKSECRSRVGDNGTLRLYGKCKRS